MLIKWNDLSTMNKFVYYLVSIYILFLLCLKKKLLVILPKSRNCSDHSWWWSYFCMSPFNCRWYKCCTSSSKCNYILVQYVLVYVFFYRMNEFWTIFSLINSINWIYCFDRSLITAHRHGYRLYNSSEAHSNTQCENSQIQISQAMQYLRLHTHNSETCLRTHTQKISHVLQEITQIFTNIHFKSLLWHTNNLTQ